MTITDTGPNAINGWTLAFSFPCSTESRHHEQLERELDPERDKRAGHQPELEWRPRAERRQHGSLGFVANQNGAYPSPASFTLNGTVCATTYSS